MIKTEEEFRFHIIAQKDNDDYDGSGWLVVVKDHWAALAHYGYDSMYGIWDYLYDGKQIYWKWQGTLTELIYLAQERLDPALPERQINFADFDAEYLIFIYQQILHYSQNPELYLTSEHPNLRQLAKNLLQLK